MIALKIKNLKQNNLVITKETKWVYFYPPLLWELLLEARITLVL